MVAIEHVVDQDDPLRRGVEGDVAALTRDHVQITLDPLCSECPGGLGRLRVNGP